MEEIAFELEREKDRTWMGKDRETLQPVDRPEQINGGRQGESRSWTDDYLSLGRRRHDSMQIRKTETGDPGCRGCVHLPQWDQAEFQRNQGSWETHVFVCLVSAPWETGKWVQKIHRSGAQQTAPSAWVRETAMWRKREGRHERHCRGPHPSVLVTDGMSACVPARGKAC